MASAVIDVTDVTTENKQLSSVSSQEYDVLSNNSASIDNSLAQSPSLESFSTFQEMENLSELNMDENTDLCVKIDNPQKHLDTLETYITFRLTTKVARIEFNENEYIVRRRYNDFIWLRHKLTECYPTHIVPPLPGKHTLIGQLDRYSKDFIIARMKLLNIFMCRVANHPILSCNEHFKVFLSAKHPEFATYRKSQKMQSSRSGDAIPNISGLSSTKSRLMEFEKAKDYLSTLSDKLQLLEKISCRVARERHDYVAELNNFYPSFLLWANSEPQLATLLQAIACATEKVAAAQADLASQNNDLVSNPIREFLMYIDVVKEVLGRRDHYQIAYECVLDELNKKRAEKHNLVSTYQTPLATSNHFSIWKQQSSDQRLEKLGMHIPQLVKQSEGLQDRLECANEALRSDLARWHTEKRSHLKKILLDFATKQMEYYQKSVAVWEHVVSDSS